MVVYQPVGSIEPAISAISGSRPEYGVNLLLVVLHQACGMPSRCCIDWPALTQLEAPIGAIPGPRIVPGGNDCHLMPGCVSFCSMHQCNMHFESSQDCGTGNEVEWLLHVGDLQPLWGWHPSIGWGGTCERLSCHNERHLVGCRSPAP
jgi:hypothetical protein